MTTKQKLYRLIDDLPDDALAKAEIFLVRLHKDRAMPPLVERLNRRREAFMHGRQFDDSTDLLRQLREAHGATN